MATRPTVNNDALQEAIASLTDAGDIPSAAIERLQDLILNGSDNSLFRVDPVRWASANDIPERVAIDLFLHATRAGLFEMEWVLVCISCGNTYKSFRRLEKVDPHFVCNLCTMENEATLDDYIQVSFTVSPALRAVAFHEPERLDVASRVFDFQYQKENATRYEDLSTADLLRDGTVFLERLAPGETKTVAVDIGGGNLVFRDIDAADSIAILPADGSGVESFDVRITDDGLIDSEHGYQPLTVEFPMGNVPFPKVHFMAHDRAEVSFSNDAAESHDIWGILYPPPGEFAPKQIVFDRFLSAKQLLNTPTFVKLFRGQTPPEGESLSVQDLTYLFTDLKGSTSMYDEIGDATAYNLIRLHFDVLGEAIESNGGVIVKTIGDAIMATFLDPASAASAALAMFERLDEFNQSRTSPLQLKVGIHRGHSVAVTLNGGLDYFGQNVNIAARTEQLAGAGEILITADALESEGVRDTFGDLRIEDGSGDMKGVAEEIAVSRVIVSPGS